MKFKFLPFLVGSVMLMSLPAYGQNTLTPAAGDVSSGSVLKKPIYDENHRPPHTAFRALTYTRKICTGKKKWKVFKVKYRVFEYTLMDGEKFLTQKKEPDVPNFIPLQEERPMLYRGLQVFGLIGPAAANGIGSGIGTAAGN